MESDEDMELDLDLSGPTPATSNKKCSRSPPLRSPSLVRRKKRRNYIPPKDACIFDGRLLKLDELDIKELDSQYTTEIGKGSFGTVFKHCNSEPSEGFDIHIAVKKIKLSEDERNKSIRREMITSKVMHPFILPLLSVVNRKERREVLFISPYFENGDLGRAIKERSKEMLRYTRVKILLQIALALKHIHTAVSGVRDVILHKDISSQNIVLDKKYNARLIDFGLAREKDDLTATSSARLHYSHPYIGTGRTATENLDYYSYGVIVREMLTSLGPDGANNIFLSKMTKEDLRTNIDNKIWKGSKMIGKLSNISNKCLSKRNKWTASEFETEVIKDLEEIWSCANRELYELPENDSSCHLCIINPAAKESSMAQSHSILCKFQIQACIACEKNSFLNPITCYCGAELSPTIGNRWGALLVAGNDIKKEGKTLECDIKQIEKLLSSHAPRIMGISENNIRTVTPSNQKEQEDNEELWPKVKEHFTYFRERTDIDTLLIYFSCHGNKENYSFILGSEADSFTKDEFQSELNSLNNIKTLLIILDRCFPPSLCFANDERKYIQINACGSDENISFSENGSTFTKYFIDGLKGKSERTLCRTQCNICDDFWRKNTNFITVSTLFDYVQKHVQKESRSKSTPTISGEDILRNIAFYTDDEVEIDFLEHQSNIEKVVPLEYFKNMEELERKLLHEFEKNETDTKVIIKRRTCRKEKELEDCDTLEKVNRAWVLRQQLEVTFESNSEVEDMVINYADEGN